MPGALDPSRQHTGTIQTDERGRRYWVMADGSRQYLAPTYGDGTEGLSPGQSFLTQNENRRNSPEYRKSTFFKGEQKWNPKTGEWEQGPNWNNFALAGAGGLLAGPALAGAFGGGSAAPAAAASSAPAASGPLTAGPLVGGLTSAVPGAGMVSGVGGAAPSVGGFLGKALSGLGGLDPKQLGALGLIAAQLFKGRGAGGGGDAMGPLNDMLALQSSQARRQDPLHQAVTQLASNLLPNSAFGAGPNRPLIG